MSPDEARDLFSDAYEKALAVDAQAAFDATLEAHAELAAEYAQFCRTLELMRQRPRPTPNLLPGVRRRLKQRGRSALRNKLYGVQPIAIGALMLVLLGVAWLALHLLYTTTSR
jgi:hypothetical protein